MLNFTKAALAALTLCSLAACGGDDADDRLDIADPVVRFVDAARGGPTVTLFRNDTAQGDAASVNYKFASSYFDVSGDSAAWSIRATAAPTVALASVTFDSDRGNRNTIVALPADVGVDLLRIRDPYNKALNTDKARVRVVNAAPNAQAFDVYMAQSTVELASQTPSFVNVQYKQALPASGADSFEFDNGDYRLVVTTVGTKNVIFSAPVNIARNADWLLTALPSVDTGATTANAIKFLLVQGNSSDPVSSEVISAP